jgi:hypothetical protein
MTAHRHPSWPDRVLRALVVRPRLLVGLIAASAVAAVWIDQSTRRTELVITIPIMPDADDDATEPVTPQAWRAALRATLSEESALEIVPDAASLDITLLRRTIILPTESTGADNAAASHRAEVEITARRATAATTNRWRARRAQAAEAARRAQADYFIERVAPAEQALDALLDGLPQPGDAIELVRLARGDVPPAGPDESGVPIAPDEIERRLAEARALRAAIDAALPDELTTVASLDDWPDDRVAAMFVSAPSELTRTDVVIGQLAEQVAARRAKRDELAVRYTRESREMREASESLAASHRRLIAELNTAAAAADARLVSLDELAAARNRAAAEAESRRGRLVRILPEYNRRLSAVEGAHIEADRLQRVVDATERLAATTISEPRIGATRAASHRTGYRDWCAMGFAAAVLLSIMLVTLIDAMDPCIRFAADAQRACDAPVWGSVAYRRGGMIVRSRDA